MRFRFATAMTASVVLFTAVEVTSAAPGDKPAVAAPAAPSVAPVAVEKPPVKAGNLSGTWSGLVSQVGRSKQYSITITLAGKGGSTNYPDQHCAGKLVRAGSSGGYSFFSETITEGKFNAADKSGCLDGSITLVQSGEGIVMGWLAGFEGKPIVAFGSLASKPP